MFNWDRQHTVGDRQPTAYFLLKLIDLTKNMEGVPKDYEFEMPTLVGTGEADTSLTNMMWKHSQAVVDANEQ